MPPAKNRRVLNDKVLKALRAGVRRVDYPDARLPGFAVRVEPDGTKTFFFRYRVAGGARRYRIGQYGPLSAADAFAEAKQLQARVARGEDPQSAKAERRRAESFGDLAERYIEDHAKPTKRTWGEDARIIAVELKDWANRPAREIRRRDVVEKLDKIRRRGAPAMARNTKALISKVFNFGLQRELVETNPAQGIEMGKAPSKDRVLTAEEIGQLWRLWDAESSVTSAIFQMLLLTAQREIEVMTMRWCDLELPWWTIPAGVVKNKLPHRVYLSAPARAILERLPIVDGSPWVFTSPRGEGQRIRSVNKAVERFRAASGIFNWSPHDLRRTAATDMGRNGTPRIVIAKVLNHVDPGVTAIYDRATYEPDIQRALVAWGERLEAIVHGRESESLAPVVRIW